MTCPGAHVETYTSSAYLSLETDLCVTCLTDPKQRISVPVGYDSEGMLGVALLLEEVKDTEEKMDSSWTGTLWKHTRFANYC